MTPEAEFATARVAGAVCTVLREAYEHGTDAEVEVARRCWYAALEAAGLVPLSSEVPEHPVADDSADEPDAQ